MQREQNSMNIAVLGGSFNPPHVAHVLAATWVLSTRSVDEVWWMPVGQHAFGKSLEPFEHRKAMVQRAMAPLRDRCRVTDIEHRIGGSNRTVDTLQHLQRESPHHRFRLIIGADILHERHSWKSWDVLERDFGFHILGREGYEIPAGYNASVVLPRVSSTFLRDALSQGNANACEGMLPREVLHYIVTHRLYGLPENAAQSWRDAHFAKPGEKT